jgi:DNA-directed RNA polymerase specialized sigma24 family protein
MKGHMRRRGDQVEGNKRPARSESAEQNHATALQSVLDNNEEELLWLAEVMSGSRQAGEECIAEAVQLAETAQYVGREWMLPWLKRLLVHAALKRISGEIREFLPCAGTRSTVRGSRADASTCTREELRSIPPHRIIASLDVLERICFVLYAYLQYPALDCALLLGCPRGWIEPVCECVLTKLIDIDKTIGDGLRDVDSFILSRSEGMRRLKVLAVGLNELAILLRDALMLRAHSKLAVVSNYSDLCSMSLQREEFQVAVLNEPNSARELRRRAKYIRRTWPDAAIVLVRGNSEVLEHRLYDERVPSRIGPADLLAVIDRLNQGVPVEPAA